MALPSLFDDERVGNSYPDNGVEQRARHLNLDTVGAATGTRDAVSLMVIV
jgi:hypothetical protein